MGRSKRTFVAFGVVLAVGCSPAPPEAKDPVLTADPPVGGAEGLSSGAANTEVQRAIAYIKNAKFEDAKKHLEAALAEKPDDSQANFYMGVTAEGLSDKKGAEGFYKKAITADPSLTDAALNLSAIYLDEETPRSEEAIGVLTKALAKVPDDAALNQQLGIAYGLKKDFANAAKAYDAALAKGENAQMRFEYGALMFTANDMPKAAEQLKKAIDGMKDAPTLVKIGRMVGRAGDYASCVKAFDSAIKIKAEPELYVRRGNCKHELKDEAGARADFEESTKADPKFAAGYYYLGMSYSLEKKTVPLAIVSLEKAAKLGEGSEFGKQAKDKLKDLAKQKP
jgi:tetratricopeptide (TPR) repeat protein